MKLCPLCNEIEQMTGIPEDYELCGLCKAAVDQMVKDREWRDDAGKNLRTCRCIGCDPASHVDWGLNPTTGEQ